MKNSRRKPVDFKMIVTATPLLRYGSPDVVALNVPDSVTPEYALYACSIT